METSRSTLLNSFEDLSSYIDRFVRSLRSSERGCVEVRGVFKRDPRTPIVVGEWVEVLEFDEAGRRISIRGAGSVEVGPSFWARFTRGVG